VHKHARVCPRHFICLRFVLHAGWNRLGRRRFGELLYRHCRIFQAAMSYGCFQVPQLSSSIVIPFCICRTEHDQRTKEIGTKCVLNTLLMQTAGLLQKLGPSALQYTVVSVCPHLTARESFSEGLANICKRLMR
jgi:hypothetical protein